MSWAPDYCSVGDLADYLKIDDNNDDVFLVLAITAASRSIDRATNRQFGVTTSQGRLYTAEYDRQRSVWFVDIDDLSSASGLAVAYDSVGDGAAYTTVTGALKLPINAAANGQPWTRLEFSASVGGIGSVQNGVKVTGLFGWTSVPTPIESACLLQASRFFARRQSPYGIAGSPEAGTEIRLLSKLDPDVALMVRPYYRWWGAS